MAEPPPFNPDTVAGPRFSVSVEYTDELLMRVYRRGYVKANFLLVPLLCFLFIMFIHGSDWKLAIGIGLIVMVLAWGMAILKFKPAFRKANHVILQLDNRRFEYTLDDSGVFVVAPNGAHRLKWSMFTKILRRKDMWLLQISGRVDVFPLSSMSTDLQDFIVRKCSENGVKVR